MTATGPSDQRTLPIATPNVTILASRIDLPAISSAQPGAACCNEQTAAAERHDEPERLDLAALPTAPGEARQFTRHVLKKWQCGAEVIDAAVLAVSELTTNAARALNPHLGDLADTDAGPSRYLALTLRRLPGRVVIEVSDDNPGSPALADADSDAEGGRGLRIVQASSERWGCRYPSSGGKVVFCVIGTHETSQRDSELSHSDGR